MARNRSSIRESVLILIIDFLSIIRNRQSWNRAYKDYNVAIDRSDFFPLTGSCKRLYKVLPTILKAIIPIGAARKTGFCFPALITSSWIRAQIFRSVKVFPDPAVLSTLRRSWRGVLVVSSYVYCLTIVLYSFLCSRFKGSGDESMFITYVIGFSALIYSYTSKDS